MADRTRYPAQSGGSIGREYVELKLKLNGASAPTVLAGKSYLSQTSLPTHSGGTNVVGITMRDTWIEAIYIAAEPRDDTPNGAYCTCGTITNEGSTSQQPLKFNINTWTAGGAVSNDSSLTVGVILCLRNSSVTYGNTP